MPNIVETVPSQATRIEAYNPVYIEQALSDEIVGQPIATGLWAQKINRMISKVPRLSQGPREVVLHVGPSGVGKTEIAHAITRFFTRRYQELSKKRKNTRIVQESIPDPARKGKKIKRDKRVIINTTKPKVLRIDCGEFDTSGSVRSLLGSPPSYVGSEIEPRLGAKNIAEYRMPIGDGETIVVIVLDEIEKAHPDFLEVFLGAFDYGTITMSRNDVVNLRDAVFIITSNLGNEELKKQRIGFNGTGDTHAEQVQRNTQERLKAVRAFFAPEQISRMGGEENIIVFEELSRDDIETILMNNLREIESMMESQGTPVSLSLTAAALELLVELSYSPEYGVRQLKAALQTHILDHLGFLSSSQQTTVYVDEVDGQLELYKQSKATRLLTARAATN